MSKGVRLLTFNVFLRPPPIKTNEDDYKEERFQEILKIIDNYDIVCFQEMFQMGTFRPQRIIQEAIKKKFYYWKTSEPPSFLPGPVVDSGLMVLSRYPIVFSHFQSYNIGVLSDSASDKGYIYCKIKVRNEIINLFLTHLQASYKLPGKQLERELSVKTRLYQFDLLLQRIKEHLRNNECKDNELVLLCGDLNIDSNEKPYLMTNNSCLKKGSRKFKENQKENKQKVNTELAINQERCIEEARRMESTEDQTFKEFQKIQQLFEEHKIDIIDHARQNHSGHPVTFGDNEVVLTGIQDITSFQSLDYIFSLRFRGVKCESTMKCMTNTCEVQQFKYPNTVFGQLSDHYGMSIRIN